MVGIQGKGWSKHPETTLPVLDSAVPGDRLDSNLGCAVCVGDASIYCKKYVQAVKQEKELREEETVPLDLISEDRRVRLG